MDKSRIRKPIQWIIATSLLFAQSCDSNRQRDTIQAYLTKDFSDLFDIKEFKNGKSLSGDGPLIWVLAHKASVSIDESYPKYLLADEADLEFACQIIEENLGIRLIQIDYKLYRIIHDFKDVYWIVSRDNKISYYMILSY